MSTHKKAHELQVLDDESGQTVTPYEPTFEEIRANAYEVYVQRGRIDGFDIKDWLQAEKELRQIGNKVQEEQSLCQGLNSRTRESGSSPVFRLDSAASCSGHPYRG